ncbi:hypothetical protein, partial [Streptococcus anginosus]|uniref:hypothetical protein n=1 Tax=Streptococcus anginosus TaxID=1328 RepID=UPI002ED892E2
MVKVQGQSQPAGRRMLQILDLYLLLVFFYIQTIKVSIIFFSVEIRESSWYNMNVSCLSFILFKSDFFLLVHRNT